MICKVKDCKKEAMYKGEKLCQMHYFRKMRNGHFKLKGFREHGEPRQRKKRIIDDRGYTTVYADGHPLADSKGTVREHRLVYFNQINSSPDSCEMCQSAITWESLHIDHIDNNPENNAPENLRALCRGCNVFRAHNPKSMGKHFLTIGDKTLTAAAWARQPGVKVAGHTIIRRKQNGASDFDAVFGERKTHHSTNTKKLETKYDELRGIA